MVHLSENWLTEGALDFEYKKYLLLAYLQQVEGDFSNKKLYPRLGELVQHYQLLEKFSRHKSIFLQQFPKKISAVDLARFKIQYQSVDDDALLKMLDELATFAIPEIKKQLDAGKDLYEATEKQLRLFPVGVLPLRVQEGYFFLNHTAEGQVGVYEYRITLFEQASEKLRGIHTNLIYEYQPGFGRTYNEVKQDLARQKVLRYPATYAVEVDGHFPLHETLLPVAKRYLVRHLQA